MRENWSKIHVQHKFTTFFTSHALSDAMFIASEITVGCTPFPINWMHLFSSAPASTVTEVVPSPALMSCAQMSDD
eukprot:6973369-Pyramimonas_sp.AAC.4